MGLKRKLSAIGSCFLFAGCVTTTGNDNSTFSTKLSEIKSARQITSGAKLVVYRVTSAGLLAGVRVSIDSKEAVTVGHGKYDVIETAAGARKITVGFTSDFSSCTKDFNLKPGINYLRVGDNVSFSTGLAVLAPILSMIVSKVDESREGCGGQVEPFLVTEELAVKELSK